MSKKLMFISSSEPLARGRVRLSDGRELSLDDSGQIDDCLPPGTEELEVLVDGSWKSQPIDLSSNSPLLVIDVSRKTASMGLVGSVLGGRYRIEAALGTGGMGIVYRATDTRLGRDVAIKMLSEQFRANDEARRLFLEEARQMAPLSHPHLVGVYDVTTIDDYDLMVTEFVNGKNLDELLIDHGRFDIDDALLVAYQLTVAVGFLHGQGVMHRDLKPANAIRESGTGESSGSVKLIDFGLARSLDHLVAKGTAVRGTPAYMAPEQIMGASLSSATDIYQLGATFYELLANELPIDFATGNFIANINKEPRPLDSLRPEIPPELVRLIHACLDKTPDARPDARELAETLGHIYFERTGTPPSSGAATGTWTAKNIPLADAPSHDPIRIATRNNVTSLHDAVPVEEAPRSQVKLLLGLIAATLLAVAVIVVLVLTSGEPQDTNLELGEVPAASAQPSLEPTALTSPALHDETQGQEASLLAAPQVGEAADRRVRELAEVPKETPPEEAPPAPNQSAPAQATKTPPRPAASNQPSSQPTEPVETAPVPDEPNSITAPERVEEKENLPEPIDVPQRLKPPTSLSRPTAPVEEKPLLQPEEKQAPPPTTARPPRAPRGF